MRALCLSQVRYGFVGFVMITSHAQALLGEIWDESSDAPEWPNGAKPMAACNPGWRVVPDRWRGRTEGQERGRCLGLGRPCPAKAGLL